jgi:predicted nucleic acid-binding protein
MIPTLDTNILVYALDERTPVKKRLAQQIIAAVRERDGPLALQACGEFYGVVTRKFNIAPWIAAQAARNLMVANATFAANVASTTRAFAEAASGRFSFWDANLLSAAEAAGCTHIFSEDMMDGAKLGRIEVIAPFDGARVSEKAASLLALSR